MDIRKFISEYNGLDEKYGQYRVKVTATEDEMHTHIVYEECPRLGEYDLDANDTKWFFSMVNQFTTRDHESFYDAMLRAISYVILPL